MTHGEQFMWMCRDFIPRWTANHPSTWVVDDPHPDVPMSRNPLWCDCECHGDAAPIACEVHDVPTMIEAAIACMFCSEHHDPVFAPHSPDDGPTFSDGSDDTDE